MAEFSLIYEAMLKLEFNKPENALHKNKGESGFTFMGIYESVYPSWGGWGIIKIYLDRYRDLERASKECFNDINLRDLAQDFYKEEFWDKMGLGRVSSHRMAELIFKFAVNVWIKRAVRFAQQVVGVKDDGLIGTQTLKALNSYNEARFEVEYKDKFVKFYTFLATSNKEQYAHNLKGWLNRVRDS